MIEKKNYRHNEVISLPDGYINGQGRGNVSKMKYGLFPMSFNGCEVIAVYNLMYSIGRKAELRDVAKEIYPYASVLMGLFGSAPKKLKRYLDEHGIKYRRSTDFDGFEKDFACSESALVSFWAKLKNGFYGIHTVFIRNDSGTVRVYNCTNGNQTPVNHKSLKDFLPNGKHLIVSFCFGEKSK